MARRKLIWTALLIAATCVVVAAGVFLRPYVVAKYWGNTAKLSNTARLGANRRGSPQSSFNQYRESTVLARMEKR